MTTPRTILHCDLNSFYASVEAAEYPPYQNVPLAVAGNPEKRHGVILAKNGLAQSYGIKTGEPLVKALRKCPGLTVVPPRFELYMRYSQRVYDIYRGFSPCVESFGPDECWLDLTGMERFGSGLETADRIRKTVSEATGLTLSVGVSYNKVFAKMGSDLKKPDATTLITVDNYRRLLWPLPVADMFMIGQKTAEKLHTLGIRTIGELAAADEDALKRILGINGVKLRQNARGENDEPVRLSDDKRENESYGHGMTATRDVTTMEDAAGLVYFLADRIAARLRQNGVGGRGVTVDLRYADLTHISRQCRLDSPIDGGDDIAGAAIELMRAHWDMSPLRTLTIGVFDLDRRQVRQLSMFDKDQGKERALNQAIDGIRLKYGSDKLRRANLIGCDFLYDKTGGDDFLPFSR